MMWQHNYPWLFRRDEIDLLEDEMEDLYAKHAQSDQERMLTPEAEVLNEQMETEEYSDAFLALTLGRGDHPSHHDSFFQSKQFFADHDCGSEDLFVMIRQHPLFQAARHWAVDVRRFAKEGYTQNKVCRREFFRVYANVNLIPIKLFTALAEETQDDSVGQTVAQEAYALVLTYLERIDESFDVIRTSQPEYLKTLDVICAQARQLRVSVLQRFRALRSKRKKI